MYSLRIERPGHCQDHPSQGPAGAAFSFSVVSCSNVSLKVLLQPKENTQAQHSEQRRHPPRDQALKDLCKAQPFAMFSLPNLRLQFRTEPNQSLSQHKSLHKTANTCTTDLYRLNACPPKPTLQIPFANSQHQAFTRPSGNPRKLAIQCIYNAASFARFSHCATRTRRNLFAQKFLRPTTLVLQ